MFDVSSLPVLAPQKDDAKITFCKETPSYPSRLTTIWPAMPASKWLGTRQVKVVSSRYFLPTNSNEPPIGNEAPF